MISPSLQQERSRILEEMAQIDRMIRGHVSQQTYHDTAHGEFTGFAYGKLISWWDRRVVLFPFQEGG